MIMAPAGGWREGVCSRDSAHTAHAVAATCPPWDETAAASTRHSGVGESQGERE
eukprot:COSAG04_NODE_24382_length_322_cov_1.834081_1_plen_53_part_01